MEVAEKKLKLAARARALKKARECITTTLRVNNQFGLGAFSEERIAELEAVRVIISRAENDCFIKFRRTGDTEI